MGRWEVVVSVVGGGVKGVMGKNNFFSWNVRGLGGLKKRQEIDQGQESLYYVYPRN